MELNGQFPSKLVNRLKDVPSLPARAIGDTFIHPENKKPYVIIGVKINLALQNYVYEICSNWGHSLFVTDIELQNIFKLNEAI